MYKNLTKMIAIVVAVCCCNFLFAQTTGTVKGKVLNDSTGKPLPNASVFIEGTKRGTVTDAQGNFIIKLPEDKQYKLQITHTGFATKLVSVKNGDNITVKIKETASEEEGVVVQTGLGGAVKKKELTGSVSTVGAKDLKDVPINSVAEALNGRLAGVTATTSEGSPDADIKIRVRGGGSITQDNSPLYIVDGVQVENGLNGLVLQDIQDITVLKDAASLSVYGARGANGVIIITTKSGKIGEPKVTYNTFYGVKKIPKTLGVMSPYEFVLYNYERDINSVPDSTSFVKSFGSFDTFQYYKNANPIDWQNLVMGNTGHTQMHNININGGANKYTYNFSYTFNDDKAIVINSSYNRHQLNFKNEYKVNEKLKVMLSTRYTNQTVYGAGFSDPNTAFSRLRNSIKYRPYLSAGQDIWANDPLADTNTGNGLALINPLRVAYSEYERKTTNHATITASLTYTIDKHFTFKSTFGYDRQDITDRKFNDSSTSISVIYGSKMPVVGLDTTKIYSLNNSNILTYTLRNYKRKHDIEVIAGQETLEINNDLRQNLSRYYPNYIDKNIAFNNPQLGQSDPAYPKHTASKSTQLSFFGILRYGFLKKYLFTFTFREDGSSKFIDENRWGKFLSSSLAWRISNEKFMEKVKFVNDLKIRASYGSVGNNRIGDYLFLSTFNNQTYYYGVNGQQVPAYSTTELANAKLKWESLINSNIGFDATILNNRINISFDYFHNKSSDLLLRVPIDPTYGFATQTQNIGRTSSRGFELQLQAIVLNNKKGVNWTSSFNISSSKNRVDALGQGMQSLNTDPSWGVNGPPSDYITKIGSPVGSMNGYVFDGFYKVDDFDYNTATQQYTLKKGIVSDAPIIGVVQPGSIKFKDLNGDSLVDLTHDRTIIGNPNPKFTGGWNNQFSYKNWDASIFINFSYGNDVYNANKIDFTNGYINRANLLKEMEGRWKTLAEDGTKLQWTNGNNVYGASPSVLSARNANATMWMPLVAGGAFHSQSWAVEDGSFIRINNITIGYSFPLKTLVKLGISRLRVYATANNVAIITKYTGYDPEVSVSKNPLTPNLDYSAYPKSRSFIFGLNVTF